MKINGTPVNNPFPTKKIGNGGKKGGGCFPALILVGLLGSGWLHMIATSAGWTS